QSPNGNLQPAEVAAALATSDEALRQAAAAILQRRAEWSEQSIDLVETWLGEAEIDDARANAIAGVIRTLSDDARLRKIVAQRLAAQDKTSPAARLALLAALAAHDGRDVPNDWRSGIAAALGSRDPAVRAAGLRVVERWKLTSARDRVRELAADVNSTPSDRLAALRTLTSLDESLRANEFDYLLTRLNAEVPVQERLAALDVIAAIPHEAARLQRLLPRIGEASPIELPPLLQAFARGSDAKVGERLVAAISEASVAPSLDLVQSTLKSYPAEVQQAAAPLIERLRNAAQAQVARLDELESQLNETPGDAARGGELFFAKAQCHLCHAARGRGGRVGPDLTAIGDIRSRRGLLEAIVFPSASFARGYEPIVVELHDGRVLTGLAGRESPEEFVLITVRDNKPAESPLKRDEIAEIQLARVSAMPQGLDAPLTRQELADLTAYLQGLRAGGSPTLGGN
ncbi:MAG TPA: heme-binding protein, partial [Pirellulales bacterium]